MQTTSQRPRRTNSGAKVYVPEFRKTVKIQNFTRGILGLSDIARELSQLCEGMRNRSPDSILTGHVRQMSVTLRSVLLNNNGQLLNRVFENEWMPAWLQLEKDMVTKVVVDASPYEELLYTVRSTGEQRALKVPGYKHGFAVHTLPGIEKYAEDRYAILGDREIWRIEDPIAVKEWIRHKILEVDGLVYDVDKCIKCVADKEGAHIDKVVDSDGIYTGNQKNKKATYTNDDAYILSRMVKFGPFTYPHVVVIAVSRYLVEMAREIVTKRREEVDSILRQFTLKQDSASSTWERIDVIMKCPIVGKINGLPLRVTPERLVMRPPIQVGLSSSAKEQAMADALPHYGESYIGIPKR